MLSSCRPHGLFLVFITLAALLGPFFVPHDPCETHVRDRLRPPAVEYPFGTDELGRCVFSRVVHGAKISLGMGGAILLISLLMGGFLGSVAGFAGGWVDEVLMRITDIFMAVPSLVLALVLARALGPGVWNMILIVSVGMWPGYARMVRGMVLAIKGEHYIEVARMSGFGRFYILRKHILPGILSPLMVMATLGMGRNILMTSSLSFLGLGIVEPVPDWGAMLNRGAAYIRTAPHIAIFPGLVITLTVLAFNLLGEGLGGAEDMKQGRRFSSSGFSSDADRHGER